MSNKWFRITQEHIDVINTAQNIYKSLMIWKKWCNDKFYGNNVGECNNIIEDFVKSNEHIIPKIHK